MNASTARSMGLRALNRASALSAYDGGEVTFAPREDRADLHGIAGAIEVDALGTPDAFGGDVRQLALEIGAGEGFAPEPAAADRAASECQEEPRIVERRQHRLLDLVERERPAGHPARRALEGPGNLSDAALRILP